MFSDVVTTAVLALVGVASVVLIVCWVVLPITVIVYVIRHREPAPKDDHVEPSKAT